MRRGLARYPWPRGLGYLLAAGPLRAPPRAGLLRLAFPKPLPGGAREIFKERESKEYRSRLLRESFGSMGPPVRKTPRPFASPGLYKEGRAARLWLPRGKNLNPSPVWETQSLFVNQRFFASLGLYKEGRAARLWLPRGKNLNPSPGWKPRSFFVNQRFFASLGLYKEGRAAGRVLSPGVGRIAGKTPAPGEFWKAEKTLQGIQTRRTGVQAIRENLRAEIFGRERPGEKPSASAVIHIGTLNIDGAKVRDWESFSMELASLGRF